MIPQWQAVMREAVSHLTPGGALHVVDFGDLKDLPGFTRTALYKWLEWYHVTPRNDLFDVAEMDCSRRLNDRNRSTAALPRLRLDLGHSSQDDLKNTSYLHRSALGTLSVRTGEAIEHRHVRSRAGALRIRLGRIAARRSGSIRNLARSRHMTGIRAMATAALSMPCWPGKVAGIAHAIPLMRRAKFGRMRADWTGSPFLTDQIIVGEEIYYLPVIGLRQTPVVGYEGRIED